MVRRSCGSDVLQNRDLGNEHRMTVTMTMWLTSFKLRSGPAKRKLLNHNQPLAVQDPQVNLL